MAASGSSSAMTGRDEDGDASLARAMKNLELREGELDDVFVGETEVATLKKQARWLALARVHTAKSFSSEALFSTLRYVWGLAQEPEMREVDDNLFSFRFSCLGDWNKVMNQGPWLFRKLVVVMVPYDGVSRPTDVALDQVAVWAQIHSIPELYRKDSIVDQLARRVGKVKSVEKNHQRFFEGDYVRVRATINVNEPLIRFVPLNLGGAERMLLHVKYEKIGYFCAVCGVMGHDMEECGDGVHSPDKEQWGKWLYAKRRTQAGMMFAPRGGMGGRLGGRRRGGRGNGVARKRLSDEIYEKEGDLSDTASSPAKNTGEERIEEGDGQVDGVTVARTLEFPDENKGMTVEEENVGVAGMAVDPRMVPPPPPGYIPPREKKRSKKGSDTTLIGSTENIVMATEAASEEDRRAQ
ncbi:hypothetical protein ACQ4PT_017548 [Festuca glaucescens]